MAITAFEQRSIVKLAVGMFNAAPGATYMNTIVSIFEANGHDLSSLAATLSGTAAFTSMYSNALTSQQFATAFLTTLGLQGSTLANDFVVGRANAGVSRGEIMLQALKALSLSGATEFAGAKAMLENKTEVGIYYSITKNIAETNLATLQNVIASVTSDFATVTSTEAAIDGTAVAAQTFALTPGVDAPVGTSGNDVFNALPSVTSTGTTVATLTALDSIDGGAGNDTLNVVDTTAAFVIPSVSVKNIETANITAAGTLKGSVVAWTGLTTLNATEAGGSAAGALTAAATTAVNLTDTAAGASTISVEGGANVSVTANGVSGAGVINVGDTTAVSGTLTVTENVLATSTGVITVDAINVKGGTTVNITANLNETAGLGNTVTGGTISVTGTTSTTAVTVSQTAAVAAAAAATAVPFTVGVTGVAAAPGVNAVTAVTGAGTKAVAAVSGVVDGKVTISDSTTATLGTIKTVNLSSYGDASGITSNALTDLTLSGTSGKLTLTRDAAIASNSLNLTVTGLSAPTIAGGVVTAAIGGDNTITDTNNEIKTLNVTTGATGSTLTAFADTALTTLNVAGSSVLTLGTANASLTTIAVSGAAGLSANVSALGAGLTSFTTTSSGKITATLDAATQTFVGSTGQDVITISADAKKVITGGSGTNDILVLNAAATTFNATSGKLTTTNVTGFEVLGTAGASSGTFDLSTLPTSIKAIEVMADVAGVTSFTKVTAGTSLALDVATTAAVTYQVADANGAADSLNLTLGTATTKAGFTTADLTLKDANDVGIGTLSVVSQGSTFNTANTITALTDNGLSTLNVSGTAGLVITGLNEASTQATAFTINNTETGAAGVTITTLTDANLGQVTFTGSNASEITHLAGLTGKVLTLSNTGTSTATVGDIAAANLTTLTLSGNVALGSNTTTAATAIGATTGVTVSGGTDNAHVNISLTGAAAAATDTITLGNGNDFVTDLSSAGAVKVTVGSGANLIDVSAGASNATYSAAITLGAHTNTTAAFDKVLASVTGTQTAGFSTTITGVAAGDVVVFKDAADVILVALTGAQQATITADATLTAAINHAFGVLPATAHEATAFQFQGDTYLVENVGTDAAFTAGTDSVVKLVGLHTIADFGAVNGAVAVVS